MSSEWPFLLIISLGPCMGLYVGIQIGRLLAQKGINPTLSNLLPKSPNKPQNKKKNIPVAFTDEELWKREQDKS